MSLSNFNTIDTITGITDLDDEFVTDSWLLEQYVGNNLFTFGNNSWGSLGTGTQVHYSSPLKIGTLLNWKQVASSGIFSAAIKTDGTLWAWGYNGSGQLGNNSATGMTYISPIQAGTSSNWSQVSTGYVHTAIIKTDGTLWTCGYNAFGQLGLSNTALRSSPTQVGSLSNWSSVSCGSLHTVAIKTDGTLWAWGNNSWSILGNNSTINQSSPIQIGISNNWIKISTAKTNPTGGVAGNTHSTAIKIDGTLWSWGNNFNGQLGLSDITNRSIPVQVGSLSNWSSVSCGLNHTAAIKTDGTLWSWGSNSFGQLGLNTVTNYSSPVQVGSLSDWSKISCGTYHTTAIKTDGTLWACGYNVYGQLGLSNLTNRSSPVQVGSLSNWKQVSCGMLTTVATTFSEI